MIQSILRLLLILIVLVAIYFVAAMFITGIFLKLTAALLAIVFILALVKVFQIEV